MSDKEKILSDINTGKSADYILNLLSPILDEVKSKIITEMKHVYRAGDPQSAPKLLAHVAQLCSLDDIESRFKARINKGNRALGELDGQ